VTFCARVRCTEIECRSADMSALAGRSGACDGGEPRAHRLSAEGHLDIGRFDGLNLPPVCEHLPNLVPRDTTRAPSRWFVLAEAQHEVLTARSDHARNARNEGRTILVVQHMEEPASSDDESYVAQLVKDHDDALARLAALLVWADDVAGDFVDPRIKAWRE
jgi:hypothetical protein